MRYAVVCLAMLLLAGCSSSDGGGQPSTSTSTTSGAMLGGNTTPPAPMIMAVPVLLDGNLGTMLHGCVFPAGQCPTQVIVPGEDSVVIEHAGANFTGLDLNLTWTATSPATERLALGFMVMADCDGCSTSFPEVEGTSPLRATLTGQEVPLNATARVYIYVYNPTSFQMMPGNVGYTYHSVDEDFHLEGTVVVEMP